uniref:Uncharacterized protein n=1 Tax=Glossina brevipalpis TaxID=37001 RepID=A0A1A9WM85_9MUSC
MYGGGDGVVATVEEDTRLWTVCAKRPSILLLWLEIDSALSRFEGGGCELKSNGVAFTSILSLIEHLGSKTPGIGSKVVASHGDIAEDARGGGGGRVGVIDISLLVAVLHEAEENDTLWAANGFLVVVVVVVVYHLKEGTTSAIA